MKTILTLLICATCTLASAQEPAHKGRPHRARAPGEKPAERGEKYAEKKNPEAGPDDHHRKHHRRHFRTAIIVYTRPAVVLVGPVWAREPRLQAEAQILRDAYLALSRAYGDYDGHRFGAMRETAMAGDLLGITLRGDGSGEESQDASDAQLDLAEDLLKRANRGLAAKGCGEAADHVAGAIEHIEEALSEE